MGHGRKPLSEAGIANINNNYYFMPTVDIRVSVDFRDDYIYILLVWISVFSPYCQPSVAWDTDSENNERL